MIELKQPISDYYSACNRHDFETMIALFSEGATVEDEGRTHRGIDEIRLWAEKTQEEYSFTVEPLTSKDEGDTVAVLTKVSGTFPGSPVELNFVFELAAGKISALRIEG